MLKKLRLDQTKKYEKAIAAYEIAKMLVAFVEGKKHILCIGSEQGDIEGWDDFIIEEGDKSFIHIQVKRQQTDFTPRGESIRKGNQSLTPLDNSMNSLAAFVKGDSSSTALIKHQFRLELPSDGFDIKEKIQLRQFRDFLTLHIKSTTTATGLNNLHTIQKDPNTINIYNWLTTWCDFDKDWNHILRALIILKISDNGLEEDIDERTKTELARIFSQTRTIINSVKSYIEDNSAYTASIAPRQLLFELKDFLLPSIPTWTQIEKNGSCWRISGIHDLEYNDQIERPSIIVPLLWNNERQRHLKINTSSVDYSFTKPQEEIFQLALHLKGNCSVYCFDWSGWKGFLISKLGGTLGISKDDFGDDLCISNDTTPFVVSEARILDSHLNQEEFGNELSAEMIKTTWKLVENKILAIIGNMDTKNNTELRDAVEKRWNDWNRTLGINDHDKRKLFKKMLHPNSEGQDICGELRIGAKTAGLIAEGLHLLLIVSVVLNKDNQDWKMVENNLSIDVIGLSFWSGPSGESRKVQEIDDDSSVNELIGKEESDILIISKSDLPESEIIGKSLADEDGLINSIASSHRPKLIVTKNRNFKRLINNGEINPLNDYLKKIIESKNEKKDIAIKNIVK